MEFNRQVLLIAGFTVFCLILVSILNRAHKTNPKLQITDVLTSDNGRYASTKIWEAGAFITHTFLTIYLVVAGTGGDGTVSLYAITWATRATVKQVVTNTLPDPPPPTTVTTTTAAGSSVETKVT